MSLGTLLEPLGLKSIGFAGAFVGGGNLVFGGKGSGFFINFLLGFFVKGILVGPIGFFTGFLFSCDLPG